MCLLHLGHRHVYAIQQRRLPLGPREGQAALNLFRARSKADGNVRTVVEFDEEELVLRICGFHELHNRLPRRRQLCAHAAAGIEHNAYRKRCIFTGQMRDYLLDLILIDLEVLLVEARYETAQGIRDRHRYRDKSRVDADIRPWASVSVAGLAPLTRGDIDHRLQASRLRDYVTHSKSRARERYQTNIRNWTHLNLP